MVCMYMCVSSPKYDNILGSYLFQARGGFSSRLDGAGGLVRRLEHPHYALVVRRRRTKR
jgi:hypothetical protein